MAAQALQQSPHGSAQATSKAGAAQPWGRPCACARTLFAKNPASQRRGRSRRGAARLVGAHARERRVTPGV